jgi:hypothetical protein
LKLNDSLEVPLTEEQVLDLIDRAGSPLTTCALTPDICAILNLADYCPDRQGSLVLYMNGHNILCIKTPKQIIMNAIYRTHLLSLMLPRVLLSEKHKTTSRRPLPVAFGRQIYLPLGATRNGSPSFVAIHQLEWAQQHVRQPQCDFYFVGKCPALCLTYHHRDINAHISNALAIGQEIWTCVQSIASQCGLINPHILLSPLMRQWVERNPQAKPDQARMLELRDHLFLSLQEFLTASTLIGPNKDRSHLAEIKHALRRLRGY